MQTSHRLSAGTVVMLTLPPLLWAGNAVVGRLMVGQIAPLALSFFRWFFALLALLPVTGAALWRSRAVLRAHWKVLARQGFLGVACYNSIQYVALHSTTPLKVSLITSAAPVFVTLIGAMLFGEAIGMAAWGGSALSVAGVAVVVTEGHLQRLAGLHLARGDLMMLGAVFLWALYTWDLRRNPLALPRLGVLTAQVAWGVLFIAPVAAYEHWGQGQQTHWSVHVVLAIGYVSLLASVVAYACWGAAVARVGAQIPSYFGNLAPLFAALLAYLFLGERIAVYHVVGAALIFAGIHVALRGRASARVPARPEEGA
ncbi:MAG: DMT family transporter [Betaproteobacteria bacterium]|nr:DMT family transporter [Betaproteobacteria bacterium]